MRVWAYIFTWNDEILVKYGCMNYAYAEKIIIYDNESTDRTVEVAKSFPNVEVRSYSTDKQCNDVTMINIINHCWKEAKGKGIDWVIVAYLDEFLWHPDMLKKLQTLSEQNYTAIRGFNYWMRSNIMPTEDKPLTELVKTGTRGAGDGFDKYTAFRPDYFFEMNWTEGMHRAQPQPDGLPLKTYHADDLKILHYKYLGRERCRARVRLSRARLSQDNIRGGFSVRLLEVDGAELDELAFPSGGDGDPVI